VKTDFAYTRVLAACMLMSKNWQSLAIIYLIHLLWVLST